MHTGQIYPNQGSHSYADQRAEAVPAPGAQQARTQGRRPFSFGRRFASVSLVHRLKKIWQWLNEEIHEDDWYVM